MTSKKKKMLPSNLEGLCKRSTPSSLRLPSLEGKKRPRRVGWGSPALLGADSQAGSGAPLSSPAPA